MISRIVVLFEVIGLLLFMLAPVTPVHAATSAPIIGEIQRIEIANVADPWSAGRIEVGGQWVWIPRNLLIDLPANRLTLQQIYAQRPAACATTTGLAKADPCNVKGMGALATISANRQDAGGDAVAGDVFIQKATETVSGVVSYINYTDGYFRVNGRPGNTTQTDDNTGAMVRLNDPSGRHTVQQGKGCGATLDPVTGRPVNNCSPDPRFTLDPDNYTNTFGTGYPMCIPSTVSRTFVDVLGFGTTTAQSTAAGAGDVLCPDTNRSINGGQPVDDSRRFAPIQIGDSITAEGNFEVITGVEFLSCHTLTINKGLTTKTLNTQPDYLFIAEAFIDVAGFQNNRARSLFIGFTTLSPADVVLWSIHRDPQTNSPNEFLLGSVAGCEAASGGGGGNCTGQGAAAVQKGDIFKIRHDVDFTITPPAKPKISPCAHLRSDPRFSALNVCPGALADGTSNLAEEFAILSPIPHEVMFRTGKKMLLGAALVTLDVMGNQATNGEYLFPFGANLGGIAFPEFVEINLDALATPFNFEGIPWNLDRRLSPGGCPDAAGEPGGTLCEATPMPLRPFPASGLDPRTQAGTPSGPYNDPNFTASSLSSANNRILSYVDGTLTPPNFNGDQSLLTYPPETPRLIPIVPTPPPVLR